MNLILKAWRNFKIRVAKRRQSIGVENKFQIGDWVHVKDQSFDLTGSKFWSFRGTGEVVDAYYGYQMHVGYRWHYKVSYKTGSNTHTITYEEQEICIDVAWIRDKRLKNLGI
jgi:hypothetical protein